MLLVPQVCTHVARAIGLYLCCSYLSRCSSVHHVARATGLYPCCSCHRRQCRLKTLIPMSLVIVQVYSKGFYLPRLLIVQVYSRGFYLPLLPIVQVYSEGFYLLVQVYSMSFTFLFYWLCRCTARAFTFLCRCTARVSPSSSTDCACAQQGFHLPLPLLPDPRSLLWLCRCTTRVSHSSSSSSSFSVIVQVYNKGFTFLFYFFLLLFLCYCAGAQQGFRLPVLFPPPPLFLLLCRCAARVSPSSSTSSSSSSFSVIVQVYSKDFTFLFYFFLIPALCCDCAGVQQGLHLPLLLLPPPRSLLRPGPRHVGLSPHHSGPAWRQRDAVPGGGGAWSGPPAVPGHPPLPAESGCGRATAAGCHRWPLWAAGRCRPHQPPVARLQGHAPPRPRPFSGSRLLPLSPQPRPLGSAPSDQHWRGVFWRPGCYSSRGDGRSEIRHEWIQACMKGKRMDSCFDGPYHGPICVYRSMVRTTRC